MNQRPNILIVCIDSLRADHLPCYGYHRDTAPNVERIAAEGCIFDNAFSAAPFSPASYASIFSNLFPHQHGVNGDDARVWPDAWPRLPEKLRELGYFTFCVSNNSFVSSELNGARGFDAFIGPRDQWLLRQHNRLYKFVRGAFGDSAARAVDASRILVQDKGDSVRAISDVISILNRAAQPFFGFVILMDPHALYHPARTRFSENRPALRRFLRDINGRQMFARLMAENRPIDPDLRQAAVDLYDGEIFHADAQLGRLVDFLRNTNCLDNTLLGVCADHGEAFGEHGVWGHGFSLHDYLTRVPLILRHPDLFTPGSRSQAMVQLHHLHDTCLAVAQGEQQASARAGSSSDAPCTTALEQCGKNTSSEPQASARTNVGIDGRRQEWIPSDTPNSAFNIQHYLANAFDAAWTGLDAAFSEFPVQTGTVRMMEKMNPNLKRDEWKTGIWSLRTRDWRYVEYDNGRRELFDLVDDPEATRDVSHAHPQRCDEFAARLAAHREDQRWTPAGDSPKGQVDTAILDRLRALGYID